MGGAEVAERRAGVVSGSWAVGGALGLERGQKFWRARYICSPRRRAGVDSCEAILVEDNE
jgi:hypothetical protein